MANAVEKGRGKVPVADYKVAKYVNFDRQDPSSNSLAASRSCYSFCMCPGGQVCFSIGLNLPRMQILKTGSGCVLFWSLITAKLNDLALIGVQLCKKKDFTF